MGSKFEYAKIVVKVLFGRFWEDIASTPGWSIWCSTGDTRGRGGNPLDDPKPSKFLGFLARTCNTLQEAWISCKTSCISESFERILKEKLGRNQEDCQKMPILQETCKKNVNLTRSCTKNALACNIILQDLVRNKFWVVQWRHSANKVASFTLASKSVLNLYFAKYLPLKNRTCMKICSFAQMLEIWRRGRMEPWKKDFHEWMKGAEMEIDTPKTW